jgi:hypothetical protein
MRRDILLVVVVVVVVTERECFQPLGDFMLEVADGG